jgi:hypothetical protein
LRLHARPPVLQVMLLFMVKEIIIIPPMAGQGQNSRLNFLFSSKTDDG